MRIVKLVVAAALGLSVCRGNVVTWNGVVDTDWFEAGNWTPAQVPVDGDDVVIDASADSLRDSATTVVGTRTAVDAFVAGREILHRDGLGGLASATVSSLDHADRAAATAAGLELSPVSLQQLIIRKTGHTTREFEQSA